MVVAHDEPAIVVVTSSDVVLVESAKAEVFEIVCATPDAPAIGAAAKVPAKITESAATTPTTFLRNPLTRRFNFVAMFKLASLTWKGLPIVGTRWRVDVISPSRQVLFSQAQTSNDYRISRFFSSDQGTLPDGQHRCGSLRKKKFHPAQGSFIPPQEFNFSPVTERSLESERLQLMTAAPTTTAASALWLGGERSTRRRKKREHAYRTLVSGGAESRSIGIRHGSAQLVDLVTRIAAVVITRHGSSFWVQRKLCKS